MARKKKAPLLTWDELFQIGLSAVILLIVIPMVLVLLPARMRVTIGQLPGAAVDGLYAAEMSTGTGYWSMVEDYDRTVYQGLDTASSAYLGSIQLFVDATYTARDLSAAAYGGIATTYVDNVTAIHDAQVRSITYMGESMANGAGDVAAAASALGGWYEQSAARVTQRLTTP